MGAFLYSPNVAQGTFYDARDNKPYTVRKLADSNCWMVDNLALELSTSKSYDVVVNATGELYGTKWTPTSCSTNGACAINGNTRERDGVYYYSWYAATAGSGTSSQTNTDAARSICPKGWRLPANYAYSSAANAKSFGSLTNKYLGITRDTSTNDGYKTMEAFPLNFPRAGFTESGSYNDNGASYNWSSTAYSSATYAYRLNFNTTRVGPQDGAYKYVGYNVRCVSV